MPATPKVDDHHSVTIRSDRRRTGGCKSTGDTFITATGNDVGVTVHGEVRTISYAEQRAFAVARKWCLAHPPHRHEDE